MARRGSREAGDEEVVEPAVDDLPQGGTRERAVGVQRRHGGGEGCEGEPRVHPERSAAPVPKFNA